MKPCLLFPTVGLVLAACAAPRVGPRTTSEPALGVQTSPLFESGVAGACLPRTGDSTRFEIVLVVDSLDSPNGDDVLLVRGVRAAPRPGYVNQSVSVEIQRAGQTRDVGTSCWHDAGIVVRGSKTVLSHATITTTAPAKVLVRVVDVRGRSMSDSTWSTLQGNSQRVAWVRR